MKKGVSLLLLLTVVVLLGGLIATPARAQSSSQAPQQIQWTSADDAAAADANVALSHAFAARTDAGDALRHSQAASARQRVAAQAGALTEGGSFEGNDQLRFPGDLTFVGGPTVPFAQSHPIFLVPNNNAACKANSCWGDPNTFLTDFADSDLSHVTDQYVGARAHDRYTLGNEFALSYTPTPKTAPLTDLNILAVLHAAALASGQTGYGHIYHVFLPPGQDLCTPLIGIGCYSPDVSATFTFCAFHISVTFKDIGHVLFSVEPFQNVLGCQVRTGTPNGQLIDSTNSTLSHELIETITDPDLNAWGNITDDLLIGAEIADECVLLVIQQIPGTNKFAFFSDPTIFNVGKHIYATQPEYSNEDHACAIRP